MYERFSDRARTVMQLANQEAQRFNHEYVGTEHILLGLVKEGSGVAANVLKNLDIDPRKIRLEVEKIVQAGPDVVSMGKLAQTPRAKKVIEYSIEEARNLNHNYLGTEHLLLGLLREQEGMATQVLMYLGLKLEDVREEVLTLVGVGTDMSDPDSRRADGPFSQDLNADYPFNRNFNQTLEHIPDDVIRILKGINDHLEQMTQEKEQAISEQDFEKAASLRDKYDKARRQLLVEVSKLQGLIRGSEDDPT
jgi:ATP-dependent Clp protease ATP-binding subunit ClpC